MRCEGCGSSVFEGEAACAECGRELPTTPKVVEVRPPIVAPEQPALRLNEEPAPVLHPEAARCAVHPDRASASTCPRCGRFCCLECIPRSREKTLCPACQRITRQQLLPGELKRVRREVKTSFFFFAAFAFALGTVMPLMLFPEMSPVWPIFGGLATLALAGCATLYALTNVRYFAWLAVFFEFIAALLLFAFALGNWISWPIVAFPIVTIMRLRKLRDLKRESEQLSA